MHNYSVLNAQKSFIEVQMENYFFIPAEKMTNFKGFYTRNVCECVCGLITSEKGYAFFHLYRLSDPDNLLQLIQRDFKGAENISIHLIGGNPGNLFFLWKEKNRKLTKEEYIESDKSTKNYDGGKAMESHLNDINNSSLGVIDSWYKYYSDSNRTEELKKIYEESILTKDENNLIQYDYTKINKHLNAMKLSVHGLDSSSTFTVVSIKDLIAYQNLSKVIEVVSKFHSKSITHSNCPITFNVIAYFDGKLKAYDPNLTPPDNMLTEDELMTLGIESKPDRMQQTKKLFAHTSLNKQDQICNLKIK